MSWRTGGGIYPTLEDADKVYSILSVTLTSIKMFPHPEQHI